MHKHYSLEMEECDDSGVNKNRMVKVCFCWQQKDGLPKRRTARTPHLAALENGVGKDSGCKSVDTAVRDLMRIGISAREAKQDRARKQSEH